MPILLVVPILPQGDYNCSQDDRHGVHVSLSPMGDLAPEEPKRPRRPLLRRARLPIVSGKTSVAVMLLCLGTTAVWIIPFARHLPPWIDVEIVLAFWWAVWAGTLARLLYTGRRLSDDHELGTPRRWFGTSSGRSSAWNWLDIPMDGCAVEGCATVFAIIFVVAIAVIGLWLMIEVVVPAVAFVMYCLVRGMLAKVANDEHGCEGKLLRSAGWAAVWASVYIAPVALLVWLMHVLHRAPAA
jgi:hypothetical protein